jgi:hypothetical protein
VFVCAYFLCLCCPVCRQRPCDGLITRPGSPTVCVKRLRNEEEARAQQKRLKQLMNE